MQKSLLIVSLVAAMAIAACSKEEAQPTEKTAPAAAPAEVNPAPAEANPAPAPHPADAATQGDAAKQ